MVVLTETERQFIVYALRERRDKVRHDSRECAILNVCIVKIDTNKWEHGTESNGWYIRAWPNVLVLSRCYSN